MFGSPEAGHLRHLIYDVLGENGVRLYAERVGVHRNTVSRALCDRNATLCRTLDLVFSLFLSARDNGGAPLSLLLEGRDHSTPLINEMIALLGVHAVDCLADRLGRTNRAVHDGLTRPTSHLWQHLEVSLSLLQYIASKGGCPSEALARRIEPEWRALPQMNDRFSLHSHGRMGAMLAV